MSTLGVVTVGQSPRDDLVPEMVPLLPCGVRIVEHGALDGLSTDDIEALAPREDEPPLISRLAGGGSAVFSHDRVMPLVQQAVHRAADDGANVVLVVCSGSFPPLLCSVPLLLAETLAHHGVAALAAGRRIGVIRPLAEQLEEGRRLWQRVLSGPPPLLTAASPYTDGVEGIAAAARELAETCELLVLDCIGYDEAMRAAATRASGRPTVLVRSTAVRLAAELLQT